MGISPDRPEDARSCLAGIAVCLLVVMAAPFVTVIGYETAGHRRMLDALGGGTPA